MSTLSIFGNGSCVALLAEGVDRNFRDLMENGKLRKSPSSRRAWIEIHNCCPPVLCWWVALLAEGVDRNQLNR